MLAGSFFETLCLGSGAQGQVITDLPRLKSGEKSTDQVRIEKQAERFKALFNTAESDYSGWTMGRSQLYLEYEDRGGTIDFEMFIGERACIVDLKLTKDLVTGYWSRPSEVDLIQIVHYRNLYYQNFSVIPECYFLIFDYTPKMNVKLLKVEVTQRAIDDYERRFDRAINLITEWDDMEEWPRIPEPSSCSKCPLQCDKRTIKSNIIYESITI